MVEAVQEDGAVREGVGTVLVVEDEPVLRLAAADMLQDEGFSVLEAGSGDEGLVLLRSHPDIMVLFTDVNLPGSLDGVALAWIAAEEHRHVRLLIVSGKAAPEPGTIPDGARFLPKPYDVSTVLAHLHEAMRA